MPKIYEYFGFIFFSDGTSQTVDFKPFILANPHPQYNRYIEPKKFKKFTIEHGNVVWGKVQPHLHTQDTLLIIFLIPSALPEPSASH